MLLTYDDFLLLPSHDGLRHEIVAGEHYVHASPVTRHQIISMRLAIALYGHATPRGLGHVFVAPYDVVLSQHDIVVPDLTFVSSARAHIITEMNIQGSPDLVVEILSDSRPAYDTRVKYQTYERHAVGEYWIIDPDANTATVHRHNGTRFVRAEIGDALTTPLLPGFALALRELFA